MSYPRREDVDSIEGIVKAVYETISGPAGTRDWERERSLLAAGARLHPARPREDGRGGIMDVFDVEEYIASRTPFFAVNDFYEVETARRVDRFGNIAQVWSEYEGRRTPDGEAFVRGVNAIQLYHDGDRWWIVSMLWDNERPAPLPG